MKKIIILLLILGISAPVYAKEECKVGWRGGYYDSREQYQECRIANALEDIASALNKNGS